MLGRIDRSDQIRISQTDTIWSDLYSCTVLPVKFKMYPVNPPAKDSDRTPDVSELCHKGTGESPQRRKDKLPEHLAHYKKAQAQQELATRLCNGKHAECRAVCSTAPRSIR